MVPAHSRYVIVGAGIHGLSTGWHLARELRRRGLGGGDDILILDKTGVGAGASGIACGVIRNNYFQPAMRELMAHSVAVWESDPGALAYHPVGYMQIAPEAMHENVAKIFAEQQAIGYPSALIEGERECRAYMLDMFGDWQAPRHLGDLARGEGRLRQQRPLAARAWPRRRSPRASGSRRGSASPACRPTAARSPRWRPTRVRCGAISSSSRPARGSATCGRCWTCPARSRSCGPAAPCPTIGAPADVDLLGPAGGHAGGGPRGVHRQPGRSPAGPARRFQRAALRRRHRRPHHRPDVGDLLQARLLLRRSSGRDLTVRRRPPGRCGGRGSVRPAKPAVHRDGGLRPDVDLRPCALPQAVRGQGGSVPARANRRDRRLHAGQLPRLRRVPAERLRHRRLQPRVQDDRGRGAGRQGTARARSSRCWLRSGSAVTGPATCTRPATHRSPGAESPGAEFPGADPASRSRPPPPPGAAAPSARRTASSAPRRGR